MSLINIAPSDAELSLRVRLWERGEVELTKYELDRLDAKYPDLTLLRDYVEGKLDRDERRSVECRASVDSRFARKLQHYVKAQAIIASGRFEETSFGRAEKERRLRRRHFLLVRTLVLLAALAFALWP